MRFEETKYTQEDFLKERIKKELCDMKIDIFDDEYYQNQEFKKLENEYVVDKVVMPKSWWIEKYIVGQERLKKIYGIYALGVEHEFSEEELADGVWMKNLAERYNEAKAGKEEGARTVKDIRQYFYRQAKNKDKSKDKSKDEQKELGLVERLGKLGFDIGEFDQDDPKVKEECIKLLYFLFGFEFDYKVKMTPFLSQPSFENIDNNIVGDRTRNGELMAYLKNNIMKGIDENYIAELKETLKLIIDRWEQQIFYVIDMSNTMADMKLLDEIYEDLQWILGLVEERPVAYMDSLLETFYLKLSLHEMIGREKELIDISMTTLDNQAEINEFQGEKIKKYMQEAVHIGETEGTRYVEVLEYIKKHRKELAQCVFGEEKIDGNSYRKFDKAVDSITPLLDFYRSNTMARRANDVPVVLLISHMQEYIFGNEKVDAKFYRHGTKDKVTYRTELDNGKDALKRSQYAWLEKVKRRCFSNLGMKDINRKVREIEGCFDKLLTNVYDSNSLEELKIRAWLMLSYIEAFVSRRFIIEKRFNYLVDFLNDNSFKLRCCDKRMIYLFLNQLNNVHFCGFMDEIRTHISGSEEENMYICLYDIEQDGVYTDDEWEAFLEIQISIRDRGIDVINGGIQVKNLLS